MTFYARPSWRMFWQVAGDVFALGWLIGWGFLGTLSHTMISAVAEPARQSARIGADIERHLSDAAVQATWIPIVGPGLRGPLNALAENVDGLVGYSQQQVVSLEQAATLIGCLVFLIPAVLMVALWLPRRVGFIRRAGETRRLAASESGAQLLALRALMSQPVRELQRVAADPVAGWRRGDPQVVARLADLELSRAGVPARRRRL